MDVPESALFDDSEYVTDKRNLIPEMLGRKPGMFLDTTRYVNIFFVSDGLSLLAPGTEDDSFTSPGYAGGTHYKNDFLYWKPYQLGSSNRHGYLVGFPRITDEEGRATTYLHIWGNNSSIFDETYVIPLMSISALYVYSELRTRLEVELDELAFDAEPRFEVPLLRNKKTGEVHFRPALTEDIEEAITSMNEAPVLVYGMAREVVRYVMMGDEQMKQLLDPTGVH